MVVSLVHRRDGTAPTRVVPASVAQREILSLVVIVFVLFALACVPSYASVDTQQGARIELSLPHQILRGEIMIISGRLSRLVDDLPIPLAKIHLQYFRSGDSDFTREVSMVTSNPSGLFEDRFNTTSLLTIGTWFVNASFPSQYGYLRTSTVENFSIVVQPALSLYVSSRKVQVGQSVSFDGFLFACIPCIQDEVTVVFSRPDNTSNRVSIKLSPKGGPYPGGYYNGTFTPSVSGPWHIRAVWNGNDVTLPAYSQIEEIKVEAPGAKPEQSVIYWVLPVIVLACVLGFVVTLWRRHLRGGNPVLPS
jgi:hypothetical protein